jgi:predicted flavoprotein YhiN
MQTFDVVIVGAGAAGMMCAVEAGRRGRSVLILDHAKAPGEKIRISGGGRCNFTNIHTGPQAFLSDNPRFCLSALRRYTPKDFIAAVDARGIAESKSPEMTPPLAGVGLFFVRLLRGTLVACPGDE